MKKQAYQVPELRDASNNIIQAGTYGRTSPLVNADNTGILDYVNNNLEALHDAQTSGNGVRAAADTKGQAIDIAALKKLITDTVAQAKKEALLEAHPVGSYYISDKSTSPASLFGGTWKALSPGLTLISQGKGTDKFGSFEFVAGQTYGERLHQLTVEELVKHTHRIALAKAGYPNLEPQSIFYDPSTTNQGINGTFSDRKVTRKYADNCSSYYIDSEFIEATGGNQSHNNIQPCIAVYIWLRTA